MFPTFTKKETIDQAWREKTTGREIPQNTSGMESTSTKRKSRVCPLKHLTSFIYFSHFCLQGMARKEEDHKFCQRLSRCHAPRQQRSRSHFSYSIDLVEYNGRLHRGANDDDVGKVAGDDGGHCQSVSLSVHTKSGLSEALVVERRSFSSFSCKRARRTKEGKRLPSFAASIALCSDRALFTLLKS